jgi:hypothetical protein
VKSYEAKEIQHHLFLTLVSGQLHTSAFLPLEKEQFVPIEQGAVWTPEPVSVSCPTGNQIVIHQMSGP